MEELKQIIKEEKVLLQHVESLLQDFQGMRSDIKELIELIKLFMSKQEDFIRNLTGNVDEPGLSNQP